MDRILDRASQTPQPREQHRPERPPPGTRDHVGGDWSPIHRESRRVLLPCRHPRGTPSRAGKTGNPTPDRLTAAPCLFRPFGRCDEHGRHKHIHL